MSRIECFEELRVWQAARIMVRRVYGVSQRSPLARDLALRDQMRRAAVSVMSNIAEGFERASRSDKMRFLAIARGSCGELRSLTYVCEDTGMLPKAEVEALREETVVVGKSISAMLRSLRALQE